MQCPQQRVRKPYLRMNVTTTMLPMCKPSQTHIYERASFSSGAIIAEFSRDVNRPALHAQRLGLSTEEQARQRGMQAEERVGKGKLQRQQGEDDNEV